MNYDEVNIPQYNGDKIERFFYDAGGNRTSQENYTLKDVTTETCTEETVVEDVTLPNGKTKTVERKQTVCETAVTQTEKQKNTLNYTANSLNQYTKLQTLNKNGEVKKEFTYEYDNNGNLKKDDINQYFYDYKNRLVKVVQNEIITVDENNVVIEIIPEQEIVNYTYDILGRRTSKTTQDKVIDYIYAGENILEERIYKKADNTLLETRENVYSNNLDDILATKITDHTTATPEVNTYFYEKNHLGSVTRITDSLGATVEQYEYDAFGVAYASVNNVEAVTQAQSSKKLSIKKAKGSETASDSNSDELIIDNIRYKRYNGVGKIGNTRLYTGREYEPETGLYYNRARYYNPDLGRFISRDPIDITDDVNLYAYVGNNGVMYVDPTGEAKKLVLDIINVLEDINTAVFIISIPFMATPYAPAALTVMGGTAITGTILGATEEIIEGNYTNAIIYGAIAGFTKGVGMKVKNIVKLPKLKYNYDIKKYTSSIGFISTKIGNKFMTLEAIGGFIIGASIGPFINN